jgi:hypothetical protein
LTIYNLGTAYLYYKAVDINNYYWDTYTNNSSGYSTSNGYYRIWTLYATSCPVSAQSNSVASVVPPIGGAEITTARALPMVKSVEADSMETQEIAAEFLVSPIPKAEHFLGSQNGALLYSVEY